MNFFFGLESSLFKSRLLIPRFRNKDKNNTNYSLYELSIHNSSWKFTNMEDCELNNNFYKININENANQKIYCLTSEMEINRMYKNDFMKLLPLNNYTETSPAFRANLEISIINGGFSSYQSDYPYSMIKKRGNVLSSIYSLANSKAEINKIYFKNIYEIPINIEFNIYIVDTKSKKILNSITGITNKTNEIEIENRFIQPDVYLFTDGYLGIPIYVSINNGHISMEHTHPPHEYILSKDRFKVVSEKKKAIYEIIKKNI